jgi:nucleoid-associated protein YgaU
MSFVHLLTGAAVVVAAAILPASGEKAFATPAAGTLPLSSLHANAHAVISDGSDRIVLAQAARPDPAQSIVVRRDDVSSGDFLAPVTEWLKRSSRTYQNVIVRRLSVAEVPPQTPAAATVEHRESNPPTAPALPQKDAAAFESANVFETVWIRIEDWLARVRMAYRNDIVHPLSTPSVIAAPEPAGTAAPTPLAATAPAAPTVPPKEDEGENVAKSANGPADTRGESGKPAADTAREAADAARRSADLQAAEDQRIEAERQARRKAEETARSVKDAEDKRLAALKAKEEDARRDKERRQEDAKRAEDQRAAREKAEREEAERKSAALREAERKRRAEADEAARKEHEAKLADERRKADEAKKAADERRLAALKAQEDARAAEERRMAEAGHRDGERAPERKAAAGEAAHETPDSAKQPEAPRQSDQKAAETRPAEDRQAHERAEAERKIPVDAGSADTSEQTRAAEADKGPAAAKPETRADRSVQSKTKEVARSGATAAAPRAKRVKRKARHLKRSRHAHRKHVHRLHRAGKRYLVHAKRVHHHARHHSRGRERRHWRACDRVVYVVRRGDTLSRIARRAYGDWRKYRAIYKANRGRIRHPDLIRRGQRIVIPRLRR